MSKTKALISVLIHIVLAVFIIVMIWPALKGNSDGYSGAVPPVVTKTVAVEELVEQVPAPVVVPAPIPQANVVTPAPQEEANNSKEDESESALYSVVDGNKLDANSYAGFKLYRNWCARCHGTYGQGMVGPNLAESLNVITEKEFFDTVENGKSGTIGSMPAWRTNSKVIAGRDQLYAYLMARADGAIGVVKPKKQ